MVDKIFIPKINDWLQRHGFEGVTADFDYDFRYTIDSHVISIGVIDYEEIGDWFIEFLTDNGYNFSFIPYPILSFLHELGHHHTIDNFSDEELQWLNIVKDLIPSDDEKEQFFTYWSFPDELAANKWLADYVSSNMDAVAELTAIFLTTWDDIIDGVWEAL